MKKLVTYDLYFDLLNFEGPKTFVKALVKGTEILSIGVKKPYKLGRMYEIPFVTVMETRKIKETEGYEFIAAKEGKVFNAEGYTYLGSLSFCNGTLIVHFLYRKA